MPSPAAAAAASSHSRPAALVADEDDLDDSEDEETVDSALSTSSEPEAAVSAAVNTGTIPANPAAAAPSKPIPNLNGVAPPAAFMFQAAAAVDDGYPTPQRKRQRAEAPARSAGSEVAPVSAEARKPPAATEDSRRLFQRLWTDEDEIAILQGFLEFTSQRGQRANQYHHDTGPFYDQIRGRIQLDFNKNQLVEKLRRLKKKYRNVVSRMDSGKEHSFKSPHDEATFEISRKIWGNNLYSRGGGGAGADEEEDDDVDLTPHRIAPVDHGGNLTSSDQLKQRRRGRKRSVPESAATAAAEPEVAMVLAPVAPVEIKVAESHIPAAMAPVPNVIQETVRSCLSPMFQELLCCAVGGRIGAGAGVGAGVVDGLKLSLLPLGIGSNQVKLQNTEMVDEKWRKQQILELEVFSKRMELVQEQIKLMLQELHSAG